MYAHGADPDAIDVETFNDICVMYNDGLIGNRGTLEVFGSLTAGIYNYIRPQNKPAYKLKDIIPQVYDYLYPPLTAEEQYNKTQQDLKSIMLANAPKGIFKDSL